MNCTPCVTSAQTAHNLDNCLTLQMYDVCFRILVDVSGKPRFRVTIVVCEIQRVRGQRVTVSHKDGDNLLNC